MDLKNLNLEDLNLSVRSTNGLTRKGVKTAEDLLKYDEESLYRIRHLGKKSVEEILAKIRELIIMQEQSELSAEEQFPEEQTPPSSAEELILRKDYYDAVIQYVQSSDVSIAYLPLTQAKISLFRKAGWNHMSDIILLPDASFRALPGMGEGAVKKVRAQIDAYLRIHGERMLRFCLGDKTALWDDQVIEQQILSLYDERGFGGYSLSEMTEAMALPEDFGLDRLKHIIGGLLAAGKLEYVDYRCYRVFDRFEDYLERSAVLDARDLDFMRRRLNGETLEDIAQVYRLTRERVRQVVQNSFDKVGKRHLQETGQLYFDEEYYRYLYETYTFNTSELSAFLGVTPSVWRFLDLVCNDRGKKDLKESPDDVKLDAGIRYRIRNYLNRKKIYVDGVWIDKSIVSLERFAVEKYCREDTSFDDFSDIYNTFLKTEGIEDESLKYTEDVLRSRKNNLSSSRSILWKHHEMFRYYDIDARDYTELLDTLNFDAFENVVYSTEKFLREYPEMMEKYDIRDQYELHNLLRKIVPDGSYHDFHCDRMPNIRFGTFDWDAALNDMLFSLAPVSAQDLAEAIHEEYGFDPATVIGTYLKPIVQFYHQGVYFVDWQEMSEWNMIQLQAKLPEDFYYLNEVRKIYADAVPGSDPADINPYNLKKMGFSVYSGYVLQHNDSSDQYFTDLLTKNDVVDLRALKDRYGYIVMFSNRLMSFKKNLQLIEFEPDKAISFRRLEKGGVTKEQLLDFCDQVCSFVEDGVYFSLQSLREDGFDSEAFELGFEDWFYSNVLLADPRLSYGYMYGNLIFYKGKKEITIKSFELDRVSEYGQIDVLDLQTELTERYGCRNADRSDIVYKLSGTGVYHDKTLDRLFISEDLYYQEIDGV